MSTEKAVTTESLKRVLRHGKAHGQNVKTLAVLLDTTPRAVRTLADELVEEGVCICAHPSTGYYLAETRAEAQTTSEFLISRGWHGVNRGRKVLANFDNAYQPDPVAQLQAEGIL